jgi:APA family basic amino acid/polyamine antiporter
LSEEDKLLFVRESSGLVKEVGTGFALLLPIALTLGPWFHFAGPQISTWNPGAHLVPMFALGAFAVFFEAIALMCLMLAMPRSGASYHFTGRGLSPIFGVMEGWRSVITNPVFRGTGSFFAVQIFAGGLFVIGSAAGDAPGTGLLALSATLNEPIPLFIAAFVMILVGFVFSYLSVKWLGWFVIILGIVNIASLFVGDIVLLMNPITSGVWDGVFGSGSYAAVQAVPFPGTLVLSDYTLFNAAAVGPALIVTVGMMWPYLIMPVAGEVSQPSKNIPLSNVGGWAGIAAMFLLSGFALESAMGPFLYQANNAFTFFPGFGNYAAVALGASPIAWFVILGPIIASVLDSPSNALWVTRPMHSMAMDRFCPEAFARVHPKYHVPHITLYFWLILATATLVYATVLQAVYLTALGALVGVAFTYVFIRWQMALAAVSLPYYRPTLWERSGGWKLLGIPLIAIGGLVSGAIFFYAMIAFVPTAQHEILFTVLVYVIGQIAYMYYGGKNKAKGIEMSAIFGQLPPE